MKIIYSLDQIPAMVDTHLIPLLQKPSIFLFFGQLGAGKTTLIREWLSQCAIQEQVTSPTFSYLNRYHDDTGKLFNHFDLYRLTTVDEFLAAGFHEQLFDPESYCFIEWPDILIPFFDEYPLNKTIYTITIEYLPDDFSLRRLSIEQWKSREKETCGAKIS